MNDIFRTMDALIRQMDHFDSMFISTSFPSIENQFHPFSNERNLRDHFLEYNRNSNGNRYNNERIHDFDSMVDRYGVESVINQSVIPREFGPMNSYSRSFQFSRVMNDGKVVEKSIETDSHGNRIEKVTRSVGEKTHSITTKSDHTGVKEQIEDLVNIEDDSVETFEKEWNQKFGSNSFCKPAIECAKASTSPKKETWKDKLKSLIGL